MRRADRLLQIIQIMRRANGPIAAGRIAEELEVSLRTLYRDMVSLESTGVPIRGEAGVGYVLDEGYDMPPLMFTASELEAIMLGARMLDGRVDEALSTAAKDVVAKIAAVVPKNLRDTLIDTPLFAPQMIAPNEMHIDMADIRRSLRVGKQVAIHYRDLKGNESIRTIWPLLISIFPAATILAAWCTLRADFRTFRIDGLLEYEILEAAIPKPRKTLFAEWKKTDIAQYRLREFGERIGKKLRGI
ncbi:MAG: YafY family protein [Rhizobiaceae bacterium]